jgi:Mn2+/Fe2+ NRAMP family transporter
MVVFTLVILMLEIVVSYRRYAKALKWLTVSLRDMRTDNATGMVFSQATAWFIIITAATVLHTAHVTTINTAADAARALEPLVRTFPHSGEIAQGLFAVGIVSLGLLAIPVMAGSTSYALSEARGKPEGLSLNPIRALVFAAVFNGIAAVPAHLDHQPPRRPRGRDGPGQKRLAVARPANGDVHRHGRLHRRHGGLLHNQLRS